MVFKIGPFMLYRSNDDHLDISLASEKDFNFGWEYGPQEVDFLVQIKVKGLNVFCLDLWRWGFDLRVLGFWWIV